jgi:hypothetical protein
VLGILGWVVAAVAAAQALRNAGVSPAPVVLMLAAGLFFGITHEPPFGPIGMLAIVTAVGLIEFNPCRFWRDCPW